MTCRFGTYAFLLVLAAAHAGADVLTLRSGEQLQGELVEVSGGSIIFRPELAGLMIVDVQEAAWYTSEGYFQAEFKDAPRRVGRFVREDEVWKLAGPGGTESWPLEGREIVEARSVAVELRQTIAQPLEMESEWPALPPLEITGTAQHEWDSLLDRRRLLRLRNPAHSDNGPAFAPLPGEAWPPLLDAGSSAEARTLESGYEPVISGGCALRQRLALRPPRLLRLRRPQRGGASAEAYPALFQPRLIAVPPRVLQAPGRQVNTAWWECRKRPASATLPRPAEF